MSIIFNAKIRLIIWTNFNLIIKIILSFFPHFHLSKRFFLISFLYNSVFQEFSSLVNLCSENIKHNTTHYNGWKQIEKRILYIWEQKWRNTCFCKCIPVSGVKKQVDIANLTTFDLKTCNCLLILLIKLQSLLQIAKQWDINHCLAFLKRCTNAFKKKNTLSIAISVFSYKKHFCMKAGIVSAFSIIFEFFNWDLSSYYYKINGFYLFFMSKQSNNFNKTVWEPFCGLRE